MSPPGWFWGRDRFSATSVVRDLTVPPIACAGLRARLQHYNTVGITSIIDRSEGPEGFRAYQTLHDAGELTVRSYVTYIISGQGTPAQVRQDVERIPFVTGWGDNWLRVGSLKTVIDGGILIGTAYLGSPWGANTQIYGFVDPGYRGVYGAARKRVRDGEDSRRIRLANDAHTTGGGAIDLLLTPTRRRTEPSRLWAGGSP